MSPRDDPRHTPPSEGSYGVTPATEGTIREAAQHIRRGDVVAFPTETVYGVGADAMQPHAVARIFDLKGRPRFDPVIVHVASPDAAQALWMSCPTVAHRLMQAFWPGPLTLVLQKAEGVPLIVTAGLSTVAVRMPRHAVALRLLQLAGCPIAAPSANRFGRPSPTTAHMVEQELGQLVSLILDGGPTPVGIESTVLAVHGTTPVLLRPGGTPLEALEAVVGTVLVPQGAEASSGSPGLLPRHYAPSTPLYLLEEVLPAGVHPTPLVIAKGGIGLLSLSPIAVLPGVGHVEVLSERGDRVEAAARFFSVLHTLDRLGLDAIVATHIDEHGLGRALMDRLRRGACGRAYLVDGHWCVVERER